MSSTMTRNKVNSDIFLDLAVTDNSFEFATSIVDAMTQAEIELTELNESIESIKALKPQCDKLDYMLAASSGALCGIIDVFLVAKPGETPLGNVTDKWFENRVKDFATRCHPKGKKYDSLESAIGFLERRFKIPYDQTGTGGAAREIFDLSPDNHHFKSLAHNPSLLGLFFSILDQFTNSSHFVSNGELISLENADPKWKSIPGKFFLGFVKWFGHLVSDVSGSSYSAKNKTRGTGLPSPLWTWTNDIIAIKAKLNIPVSETDKAINQLALELFEKGYDTRFQAAQTIPVFINELLVRFIYSIRRLFKYFSDTKQEDRSFTLMWKTCEPFSNPTVKRMLTVAHGTFCLVDVGDATIRAFIAGGGIFDPVEFFLRLNVPGVGRFAFSLYGETKRAISYHRADKKTDFERNQKIVVENYMQGLKILSVKYDDAILLAFISDFENSNAYKTAFEKTVSLAELRDVPEEKILRNKADIDRYFGGC